MAQSFFDYYKMILEKVSFDSHLFEKEYRKAICVIQKQELDQLHEWIEEKGFHAAYENKSKAILPYIE